MPQSLLISPNNWGDYTRSVSKDSDQFKLIVCSLTLELLGFVPFRVLCSTFNTLLPVFLPVLEAFLECLFWNTAQLCHQIFFNLDRCKMSSFQYEFQLSEETEVHWCKVWWVRRLGDERHFMLCEKIMNQQGEMCQCCHEGTTIFFPFHKSALFLPTASQLFHHL